MDNADASVRIVVYPAGGEPEITEVSASSPRSATQKFTRFVSEKVVEAGGDSPDDRVQNAVARSKPVRAYADAVWPALDPVKLIMRLLTDAEFLRVAAAGILSPEEQQLIMMKRPPRSLTAARWSLADVILIDEVADLLQRTPSRGHVIIDEAQDLSPMMLRAVGRRATTGSITVLGDLAQATTPWATRSWRSRSPIWATPTP